MILSRGGLMAKLKGLVSILSGLRVEKTHLVTQLRHLDAALALLGKLNGGSSYGRPKRTLSVAARKKISLAQKARWGKQTSNGQSGTARPKRTMSGAARKKIAAAQRARWA